MLVLDRRQTAAALRPDAVLDAVGRALVSVAREEVSVPPRIAALTPTGLLGAMPGWVPGLGAAAKLVTVTADPGHPGRSFHRGLVALFDEHDGRALALVDGEPLTEVRTAAVATRGALALAV
ncbi:ornithine cyclodeaminase family protein, partial [Streptomyces sp. NPDC048279]